MTAVFERQRKGQIPPVLQGKEQHHAGSSRHRKIDQRNHRFAVAPNRLERQKQQLWDHQQRMTPERLPQLVYRKREPLSEAFAFSGQCTQMTQQQPISRFVEHASAGTQNRGDFPAGAFPARIVYIPIR